MGKLTDLPPGIRVRSGHLYISYQQAGKRKFETLGLKATRTNVALAARIRAQKIQALKYGIDASEEYEDLKIGTFASVSQAYLDALETKHSTHKSYRELLQIYWIPELQHRHVANIDLPLLRRIVRNTEWSSKKVQQNAVSVLRQVFAFAVDDGYRKDNPAPKLTSKGKKLNPRSPDPYTIEEREKLLKWLEYNASASIYAYFLTAFFTGIRTGELIALTWDDYDARSLTVEKARVRGEITTTKTNDSRTVLVTKRLGNVLNDLPSRFRKGAIFTNQYDRPYQAGYHLNKRFRVAHEATGVRHRSGPYPWRHTYASIGLSNGAEPAWLAKQLGHSLQMFYNVYAEWIGSDEKDQKELAKIQ